MAKDVVPGPDTPPLLAPNKTIDVNLDELDGKLHEGVDLVGYRLTGQVREVHDLSFHNFISCIFDHVFANEIDLTRCDFKDVLVRDSHFRRCPIQASTHSTTFYVNSIFEECDFTNGAHTGCEYREVTFKNSQLSNLLMKNSRLTDCIFEKCETKTHVFEGNVFLRTRFVGTDLELRAVLSNFGLKRSLTDDCRIRNARVSEAYTFLTEDDLRRILQSRDKDPLALLSILYFLNGNLLCGGEDVDAALDVNNWLGLTHQPASFAQLIEMLAEFLVNSFESNEVDVHKVLLLHDITRQIIAASPNDSMGNRIRLSFGGIHLALSRIVEEYLAILAKLVEPRSRCVRVLANGPSSMQYFETTFAEVLKNCGVRIYEVRPHNSPTEVGFVEFLPGGRLFLVALLLATFVRVELIAHSRAQPKKLHEAKTRKKTRRDKAPVKTTEFFELAAGLSAEQQKAYELRVKALVPLTSLIIELKLAVSTQLIQKLRNVIIRILE